MRKLILNDYGLWTADRANHWMLQTRIRARRWMMKVYMKIRHWQGWGLATRSAKRCLTRPLLLESRTHKGLERAKERWEVGWAIMQEKSSNAWVHVCELVCFRVKYEAMILMRQPSSPLNFRLVFFLSSEFRWIKKMTEFGQSSCEWSQPIVPITYNCASSHIQTQSSPFRPMPSILSNIRILTTFCNSPD